MDDTDGAIANYKESADLLSKLEQRDSEVQCFNQKTVLELFACLFTMTCFTFATG